MGVFVALPRLLPVTPASLGGGSRGACLSVCLCLEPDAARGGSVASPSVQRRLSSQSLCMADTEVTLKRSTYEPDCGELTKKAMKCEMYN